MPVRPLSALAGFALVLVAQVGTPLNAATFSKAPYLVATKKPGTMHVVYQTNAAPTSAQVSWGRTEAANDTIVTPTMTNSAFVYRADLTGLPAGQRVYYKVVLDGVTKTGSFVAPRPSDTQDITFYAYGDTRSTPANHAAVANKIMADVNQAPQNNATFLLHSGDYIATGSSEPGWNSEFFATGQAGINTMLANLPIIGTIGNHEGSSGLPLMKKYFPHNLWASAGWYFSYDNGPVHVAVVDVETGTSYAAGSPQLTWLENDLKNSKAPLKVVCWHSPAYTVPSNHGDLAAAKTTIVPLMEKYGAQVAVNGDNHFYSRIIQGKVTHLTSGGGGTGLYSCNATAPGLQFAKSEHHFLRFDVKVAQKKALVTVISKTGATLETFELALNGDVLPPTDPLGIATQPASQTVQEGASVSFTVLAKGGKAPYTYQWYRGSISAANAISGATSATYTFNAKASDDKAAFAVRVTDAEAKTVDSAAATLTVTTVGAKPEILTQPASQSVVTGKTATFSVTATGTAPLSYQWYRGTAALSGATSASYTTPATTAGDNNATFFVRVSNSAGSVDSAKATLTVNNTAVKPAIVTEPLGKVVPEGKVATFAVVATGTDLQYQWFRDDVAIPGATSSTYTTDPTTSRDQGAVLHVVVKNSAGTATSTKVTLSVRVLDLNGDKVVDVGDLLTLALEWGKDGKSIADLDVSGKVDDQDLALMLSKL